MNEDLFKKQLNISLENIKNEVPNTEELIRKVTEEVMEQSMVKAEQEQENYMLTYYLSGGFKFNKLLKKTPHKDEQEKQIKGMEKKLKYLIA